MEKTLISADSSSESIFPEGPSPFFNRGGSLWNRESSGVLAYNTNDGQSRFDTGFRVVLVEK